MFFWLLGEVRFWGERVGKDRCLQLVYRIFRVWLDCGRREDRIIRNTLFAVGFLIVNVRYCSPNPTLIMKAPEI